VPIPTTVNSEPASEADATDESGVLEIEYGKNPPEIVTCAVSPLERVSEDGFALNPDGLLPRSLQPYSGMRLERSKEQMI
jgi:hypothetical protein